MVEQLPGLTPGQGRPTYPPGVPPLLSHLAGLTFDVDRGDERFSPIAVYAEPFFRESGAEVLLQAVAAAETGFEGIACVDDVARAVVLALDLFDDTGDRRALALAERWLTFVTYMQYPDGTFANFIRNTAGVRNASSPTSKRGGYWWSGRARWALARAYALTGAPEYLERFLAADLAPVQDGKMAALLALGDLEVFAVDPSPDRREVLRERARCILDVSAGSPYFLDQPGRSEINLWGYHQVEAMARLAHALGESEWLRACDSTIERVIQPATEAGFWHEFPARTADGVCAYDVSPAVRGLRAMYAATGDERYRALGLDASAWLYGQNTARANMFDHETGRCRDGISGGQASENCGAESSIEAGFIVLARQALL